MDASKNLQGKETKEEEKRQKKGEGRLLREGRILGTIRYVNTTIPMTLITNTGMSTPQFQRHS